MAISSTPLSDDRHEVSVTGLPPGGAYPWLTACVVPRPIAWVATLGPDGVVNLAPHSFFTIASVEPPIICFTSVGTKDSVRNVRATGEFTVSLVPRSLAGQANVTGTDFPADVDELAAAGLHQRAGRVVGAPQVAQSPVSLECLSEGERAFGSSVVVFGRVVHLSVAREVLAADGLPDIALLDPVSRLGRNQWAGLAEPFDLVRPTWPPTPPPT